MALLPSLSLSQVSRWLLIFGPEPRKRANGATNGQSPETRDCPLSEERVFIRPQRGFPMKQEPG